MTASVCPTFPSVDHEFISMPDGQPHFKFGYDWSHGRAGPVFCRITSPGDIVNLGLLLETMTRNNKSEFRQLQVLLMYLMGGRMDRAISENEPHTLKVVSSLLNSLPISRFDVFAPHSQASIDLLRNAHRMLDVENCFYSLAISWMGRKWRVDTASEVSYVMPDLGAVKRLEGLKVFENPRNFVLCHKKRDLATGRIKEFKIVDGTPKKHCIIIDDLCDGGATFIKVSEALRANGAEKVGLSVCHGVFSRGTEIKVIDLIATTDSFLDWSGVSSEKFFVYSVFPR